MASVSKYFWKFSFEIEIIKFVLSENLAFDVDSNYGRAIASRKPNHSSTEA